MNDFVKLTIVLGVGVAIGRAISPITVNVHPSLHVDATVPVSVDNVEVKPFRQKSEGKKTTFSSGGLLGPKQRK